MKLVAKQWRKMNWYRVISWKQPSRPEMRNVVSVCKVFVRHDIVHFHLIQIDSYVVLLAGIFLSFVGGTAAIFGFSRTVMTSRKQDQQLFETGTVETARLLEGGTKLASRALAWGTFYAFLGTGTICYGIWKLSGATNVIPIERSLRAQLINNLLLIVLRWWNFDRKWVQFCHASRTMAHRPAAPISTVSPIWWNTCRHGAKNDSTMHYYS